MDFAAYSAGTIRRLGRLLDTATGYAVIVAIDHGIAGVPDGAPDPGFLLRRVLEANPDAVLLNVGLARLFARELAKHDGPGLVLALDQVVHRDRSGEGPAVAHGAQISVTEAVRLGAECVKVMLIMGGSDRKAQLDNLSFVAAASESCHRWGMPLMVEPYLWGDHVPNDPTERSRLNADGARMAVEIGADILKVEYGGNADMFRNLVRASPIPVVVLGGPKRSTERETLSDIVLAAEAGVRGVAIGRNIWGFSDPVPMVRALSVALSTRDLGRAVAELESSTAARAQARLI